MPISYVIDTQQDVIFETWRGGVTASDVRDYWYRLTSDKLALSIRRSVADLRELQVEFSEDELFLAIRTVLMPALGNFNWTAALVIQDATIRDFKRQYQTFMQSFARSRSFRDPDAALAWLLAQEDLPGGSTP